MVTLGVAALLIASAGVASLTADDATPPFVGPFSVSGAHLSMVGVQNDNAFPMVFTAAGGGPAAAHVQWADGEFAPGTSITGSPRDRREFPAVVPAHGSVRVRVIYGNPTLCATTNTTGTSVDGGFTITWTSGLEAGRSTLSPLQNPGMTIKPC